MFEYLGDRLSSAIKNIKGMGKITEDNIDGAIREIRMALLEADVNYEIVREFTNNVKAKALGLQVSNSLKPEEVFIKLIKDELIALLGESEDLYVSGNPSVLMLVGLQGSGKTTTSGKLALFLRKKYNKKPLLVACDIYRPAAVTQLQQIGKELNIPVFSKDNSSVNEIITNALVYAKENGNDYVIIDTAGRLQLDEKLMNELKCVEENFKVDEKILVIDSMIGQDAINVIKGFNETLNLTGCILTKMDSTSKGGVALCVRHLTNVPIKFIADSEKMDGLSIFDAVRMANRILDMGDILSIAEKAEGLMSEDEAKDLSKKMLKGKYDFEDFLNTMKQIKKLGPLENLIKLIPGARKMGLNNINIDPKEMAHVEAIILSMTPYERKHPEVLKAQRKIRIANGCGMQVQDVNRLINQFDQMKQMIKNMSNGNMKMPF